MDIPDLFRHPADDITMVICPGIANHSEKQYIRTFVDYAQKNGYRCAVLNHLGALPNIELTSPRMFTYGKQGARPRGVSRFLSPLQCAVTSTASSQFRICASLQEMVGHTDGPCNHPQLTGAETEAHGGSRLLFLHLMS